MSDLEQLALNAIAWRASDGNDYNLSMAQGDRRWLLRYIDRYGGIISILRDAEARGLTIHVATRRTCAEHLEHGDDKPPTLE